MWLSDYSQPSSRTTGTGRFIMSMSIPRIKLLHSYVDDEGTGELRLLMEDEFVKYVTTEADLYEDWEVEGDHYRQSVVRQLPPLPTGNWNQGHISLNTATGQPRLSEASRVELPGIETAWHPTRIDHLDVHLGKQLYINVFEATSHHFDTTVMVKFFRLNWPDEIRSLAHETTVYKWLRNSEVGLTFLGHMTEEGRVIGFITTRERGCRPARPGDLAACRSALSKLHALGIRHGDIEQRTFRIRNGQATLVDFENAVKVGRHCETLEREMARLHRVLEN